ncbi:hypothetical protein CKO31_24145 [Thiohalocapsa halophila]|uniref:Uncharacterized protein n=1 Tax=Thiohalocapsa halophila TaxID=69359 RepID=A0ABS1CPM5_9GAMM|nr:hypothetical protein [Thiohalocapsa halophila]MBK1633773.1 hypothetical protein [Thiohalocapsa halophila]
MTATEYTPGPWRVLDLRTAERPREVITVGTQAGAICRLRNDVSERTISAEDEANAHLIAAAPDLAAALAVALEFLEFCWRDVSLNEYAEEQREQAELAIRAALAKARGED